MIGRPALCPVTLGFCCGAKRLLKVERFPGIQGRRGRLGALAILGSGYAARLAIMGNDNIVWQYNFYPDRANMASHNKGRQPRRQTTGFL